MAEPSVVIVANPKAANGRARRRAIGLDAYLRRHGVACELRFTTGPGDATRLTREALNEGARTILVVGGDGTLNEAVNGFFESRPRPDAALAIAPVGTGTDFAKTVRQSGSPQEVLDRLRRGRVKPIDAGLVEYTDLQGRPASRHFVNIAEFGSGGAVVEKVNRTTKALGGRMSFLLAILSVMPKYVNKPVRYRVDDGPWNDFVANNVIVANGRYFGGGLMPAPAAELDDGLFDIVVVGNLDWRTIRRHVKDLRRGTHLTLPGVSFARGREMVAESKGRALLDLDGELVGSDPARFVVVPRALNLLV